MQVYVTDEPMPTSAEVLAAANGAPVFHGIPPRYVDVIPAGTLGLFDLPDEASDQAPVTTVLVEVDPVALDQAIATARAAVPAMSSQANKTATNRVLDALALLIPPT